MKKSNWFFLLLSCLVVILFIISYWEKPFMPEAKNSQPSGGTIISNEQLNGKRVGFVTGMIQIQGFRPKYKSQEYEFNNYSSMLEALKADKIDAMLIGDSTKVEYIKNNPELIALPPYCENYSSVGINKNNTELANKLRLLSVSLKTEPLISLRIHGRATMRIKRFFRLLTRSNENVL